jgi:hypothetical protein
VELRKRGMMGLLSATKINDGKKDAECG